MKCNFIWRAPWLHPDSFKVTHIEQECILDKGHVGNHQSITKVMFPNIKTKEK